MGYHPPNEPVHAVQFWRLGSEIHGALTYYTKIQQVIRVLLGNAFFLFFPLSYFVAQTVFPASFLGLIYIYIYIYITVRGIATSYWRGGSPKGYMRRDPLALNLTSQQGEASSSDFAGVITLNGSMSNLFLQHARARWHSITSMGLGPSRHSVSMHDSTWPDPSACKWAPLLLPKPLRCLEYSS